jgi:hypothetical protein
LPAKQGLSWILVWTDHAGFRLRSWIKGVAKKGLSFSHAMFFIFLGREIIPEKSVKRDASHSKTFKTLGILDVHF